MGEVKQTRGVSWACRRKDERGVQASSDPGGEGDDAHARAGTHPGAHSAWRKGWAGGLPWAGGSLTFSQAAVLNRKHLLA